MPRKQRKAAAKSSYAQSLGELFRETPKRKPGMFKAGRNHYSDAFNRGEYDVKALFAAAARGELEPLGAMPCEPQSEQQRRETMKWLRGPGYKAWLRGE